MCPVAPPRHHSDAVRTDDGTSVRPARRLFAAFSTSQSQQHAVSQLFSILLVDYYRYESYRRRQQRQQPHLNHYYRAVISAYVCMVRTIDARRGVATPWTVGSGWRMTHETASRSARRCTAMQQSGATTQGTVCSGTIKWNCGSTTLPPPVPYSHTSMAGL
jgi:hypothetical protein